jgi:hypothetical protein
MPTSLDYEQSFPADPATVMTMLQDPAYVQRKAESTGAFDIEVEVVDNGDGTVTITSTRSMPAEVPSYATPFVGENLTITEVQTWGAAAADGSRTAQVTVDFHAPLSYRGTIELSGGDSSSVARNAGQFKANVPFVGGKVERVAAEMTEKYLAKEAKVAVDWLAG